MQLRSARVLWDMVTGPMPKGLLGVGAGDLHRTQDGWTFFLGGYSTSFRNRLYQAVTNDPDPATARWSVVTNERGRAEALTPDASRRQWDGGGIHTPSFLPAEPSTPARIYYAGRAGRRHVGRGSTYSIGVLELRGGNWRRVGEPILTGGPSRPSVLEPRVIRHDGQYMMWYLATPHEVASGEQPNYQLQSTTSADGVTGWSTPQVFAAPAEGFFDVALHGAEGEWTMVLAAGTNLHRTRPFPPQGLWMMTAPTPSPDRNDWSEPVRLLDTDAPGTPAWMGNGVCDPAFTTSPDGGLVVFVSGTHRYRNFWSLVAGRVIALERPPVPAPFHLSTAVLHFDLGSKPATST